MINENVDQGSVTTMVPMQFKVSQTDFGSFLLIPPPPSPPTPTIEAQNLTPPTQKRTRL